MGDRKATNVPPSERPAADPVSRQVKPDPPPTPPERKPDGGPAFAQSDHANNRDGRTLMWRGMSIRDYFAGQALSGWYSGTSSLPHRENLAGFAEDFYLMADAMLKARAE